MKKQISYMIFNKPAASRVWTRTPSEALAGMAMANLIGDKSKAERIAAECNKRNDKYEYTVFECKEAGE